jgi:hypothetical protein
MDGRQPPEHVDITFEAVEGVHGPQNTPMLWGCIIAGTKERFEGRTHPQPPQKLHRLSQGVVPHPLEASAWSTRPHVGARGPFLPAAAMVVAVVMPVVFCAKATETCNENTKTCFLLTII